MRGLEIRIELMKRVPQPVGLQIHTMVFESGVELDTAIVFIDRVFIGVVAEVKHDIEIVLQHVPIRDVMTARPVLTGRERERKLVDHLVRRGRGPKMPNGALLAPHAELIEVVAARLQQKELFWQGPMCTSWVLCHERNLYSVSQPHQFFSPIAAFLLISLRFVFVNQGSGRILTFRNAIGNCWYCSDIAVGNFASRTSSVVSPLRTTTR